jgi:hypothetical protein
LDIARQVFQVHGVDQQGKVVLQRRLRGEQVAPFFANLSPWLVGLEACGGAHYWTMRLRLFGHTVRMMAPQFVKPYAKSNQNDSNDAEAICEAVSRPQMRFVTAKEVEHRKFQERLRKQRCPWNYETSLDLCAEISIPISFMTRTASGFTRLAWAPALAASNRSPARWRRNPSAIWLRQEYWVPRNKTFSLTIVLPPCSSNCRLTYCSPVDPQVWQKPHPWP